MPFRTGPPVMIRDTLAFAACALACASGPAPKIGTDGTVTNLEAAGVEPAQHENQ